MPGITRDTIGRYTPVDLVGARELFDAIYRDSD